jgi:hypothetical protein
LAANALRAGKVRRCAGERVASKTTAFRCRLDGGSRVRSYSGSRPAPRRVTKAENERQCLSLFSYRAKNTTQCAALASDSGIFRDLSIVATNPPLVPLRPAVARLRRGNVVHGATRPARDELRKVKPLLESLGNPGIVAEK